MRLCFVYLYVSDRVEWYDRVNLLVLDAKRLVKRRVIAVSCRVFYCE